MKRIGGLWQQIIAPANLYRAWRKARLGKSSRASVARFALNLERELGDLSAALSDGRYQPGCYRLFTIYERKPRQIAAAPFRDRVVHHAIMNVIEPLLDRTFIHDSYACRHGKGVHRAVDRYQHWCRKYRYALKIDIASYFASIDHDILKQQLARKLKEPPLLELLGRIIDGSPPVRATLEYFDGDDLLTPLERRCGIPIGNLTSQFFANFHLNELDHFVKQELGASAYLRYVDDMILLADDKPTLWRWHDAIAEQLAALRLRLRPSKCHLTPTEAGLDVLGYRVFPGRRELRNDNGHRFARKFRRMARAYAAGRYRLVDFQPTLASWIGHASHADTIGLRRAIFGQVIFQRGRA